MNENQIKVFENVDFGKIKEIESTPKSSYIGYFYLFECGDYTKIGRTKKPYQRLLTLRRTMEGYGDVKTGRFALSIGHTNYGENERLLHDFFSEYRKNQTELFKIPFDTTLRKLPVNLIFKDDSAALERDLDKRFEVLKQLLGF